MTIETINVGNKVNDGLGDDLRSAFQKVNNNFLELSNFLTVTAENLGNGSALFKRKFENSFEFRTIIAGSSGITITQFDDTIEISNTGIGFKRITSNSGFVLSSIDDELVFDGSENIDVSINGPRITFDTVKINNQSFKDILSVFDFGYANGKYDNAIQFAVANTGIDFGNAAMSLAYFDLGNISNQGS